MKDKGALCTVMVMGTCARRVLTGKEPVFDADAYEHLKRKKNCLAYSLSNTSNTPVGVKATPGLRAGITRPLDLMSCPDTQARVLADNPDDLYIAPSCEPCKDGFYRAWLALDNQGRDFHVMRSHGSFKHRVLEGETYESIAAFYGVDVRRVIRWNQNQRLRVGDLILVKVWGVSHKRGLTEITVKDSCGRFLKDPVKAAAEGCMDYGNLVYTVLCKPMCVRVKAGGLPTI